MQHKHCPAYMKLSYLNPPQPIFMIDHQIVVLAIRQRQTNGIATICKETNCRAQPNVALLLCVLLIQVNHFTVLPE